LFLNNLLFLFSLFTYIFHPIILFHVK